MFTISKAADLNQSVQGGQLYRAIPFSKVSRLYISLLFLSVISLYISHYPSFPSSPSPSYSVQPFFQSFQASLFLTLCFSFSLFVSLFLIHPYAFTIFLSLLFPRNHISLSLSFIFSVLLPIFSPLLLSYNKQILSLSLYLSLSLSLSLSSLSLFLTTNNLSPFVPIQTGIFSLGTLN